MNFVKKGQKTKQDMFFVDCTLIDFCSVQTFISTKYVQKIYSYKDIFWGLIFIFILGTGEKNKKTSQGNENSDQGVYIDPSQALDKLLHLLTRFNTIFQKHGLDPQLISKIFRETFYYICAGALNNILLRKDMCHWSKGMQIRYNVAQVNIKVLLIVI